jgi:hypothetical protein
MGQSAIGKDARAHVLQYADDLDQGKIVERHHKAFFRAGKSPLRSVPREGKLTIGVTGAYAAQIFFKVLQDQGIAPDGKIGSEVLYHFALYLIDLAAILETKVVPGITQIAKEHMGTPGSRTHADMQCIFVIQEVGLSGIAFPAHRSSGVLC